MSDTLPPQPPIPAPELPSAPPPVMVDAAALQRRIDDMERQLNARPAPVVPAPVAPPAPAPASYDDLWASEGMDAVVRRVQSETMAAIAPMIAPTVQQTFVSAVDPDLNEHGRHYLGVLAQQMGLPNAALLDQNPEIKDALRRSALHYQDEMAAGRVPKPAGATPALDPGVRPPAPTLAPAPPAPMSPEPGYGVPVPGLTITPAERADPMIARYISTYGEARYLATKATVPANER